MLDKLDCHAYTLLTLRVKRYTNVALLDQTNQNQEPKSRTKIKPQGSKPKVRTKRKGSGKERGDVYEKEF